MGVTAEKRAELAEKYRQALELRIACFGFDAIGRQMKVSTATAHNWVEAALRATIQEPADELRRMSIERLDRMQKAIWPTVMRGDLDALDRALRIEARRAALTGLDKAPDFNLAAFLAQRGAQLAESTGLDASELVTLADKIVKGRA